MMSLYSALVSSNGLTMCGSHINIDNAISLSEIFPTIMMIDCAYVDKEREIFTFVIIIFIGYLSCIIGFSINNDDMC